MLTPLSRLLFAALAFLFGAGLVYQNSYFGFVFLGAAALLLYGHFKYGTVRLAFKAVARGRVSQAAELLASVKRPESLAARERAYYELASGFVSAARGQNEEAERHLRAVNGAALHADDERALGETVLAQLLIARSEIVEATAVLDRAATRNCRPAVAERIRALRAELPTAID